MTEAAALPRRKRGFFRRLPWRGLRRVVQLAFLFLFFWLLRKTEFSGADSLAHPVNIFFRLDPLIAASAMLGGRAILTTFWPALVVIVLSVLLGRFFCGWFCPLGTILDLVHRMLRQVTRRTNGWVGAWAASLRPVRYVALVIVLLFASLSLPIVGYLDPFALLLRASAFSIDPALYRTSNAMITAVDNASGRWSAAADRITPVLRDYILPFSDRAFLLSGVALAMIAVICGLEFVKRRFWCRYLCPLGAMVSIAARFTHLRRVPFKSCPKCPAGESCDSTCRMDAFSTEGNFKPEDCNLCMDCVADCPDARTTFKFKHRDGAQAPVDLSRRAALITLAAGIATPAVVKAARVGQSTSLNPSLIRPPGVDQENRFLDLCVRCGLCLKVCPTNALQPTTLMAGIEGIFSPRLVPRMGYCEINCTLCGQVCPTGAIPRLDPTDKASRVMGKAVLDLERCLPWATNEECICCEEHCPMPDKAIGFDEVQVTNAAGETITLKRPFIHWDRCNGCGICENKCPIEGESAVVVRRTESVPRDEGRGGGRGRGRGGGRGRGAGRGRGRLEGEVE